MTSARNIILFLGLLSAAFLAQQTPQYNPQVGDIQNKRDAWCRITNVPDNRYNSSQLFYYRSVRQTIYSDNVVDAFAFYKGYDTTKWIQTMRWATGLLLVMVCLSVITFVVFLVYCCLARPKERNFDVMRGCIVLAWILFVLFIFIFVVVMIFIALSEVAQRRSKCQLLNVGNMLISGYKNQNNGNNYVGLATLTNILNNLNTEYPNLINAVPSAQSILNSNLNFWSQSAVASLGQVYLANSKNNTVGTLGEVSQGYILSSLTNTINPYVGFEFNRLLATSSAFIGAAQAVPNLSNAGNAGVVAQNIQNMNLTLNYMINDVSDTTEALWNNGGTRYVFATGAYWAIFASSIVLIIAIGIMLGYLDKSWNDPAHEPNITLFKVLLCVVGFFLVWYGVLVIIMLAGSTSIATFCTVLSQVNQGQTQILDNLPSNWQTNPFGLSKEILKECVTGNTGNLLNFANSFTISNYSQTVVNDVQQLITGLSAYKAWISNPYTVTGASTLNFYVGNLTLVQQGVLEDHVGQVDESYILGQLISGSNVNNSITAYLCNVTSPTNSCLNDDVVNSFNALTGNQNYTIALPYYQNLQAYIISEQNAVVSLVNQVNVGNNSPSYKYGTANGLLWSNQASYQNIIQYIPKTLGSFSNYTAGLTAFDCRNIKTELIIFEDHLCFELNYWVNVLVVITAVSLMLLFFLAWALCAAARHSTAEGLVATMPEPRIKEDPALDVNDREIIPSM